MVSTTRDKEVFLLTPGGRANYSLAQPPRQSGAILVVEDDAPTLRLERVLLEEAGYPVEVAATGEEAIDAVASLKPVLVILDIGLPGMDGFTTCQRIRDISDVPIIMVTGRDGLDDKVSGMNLGADDYVTKPFLANELAARVRVLLRRTSTMAPPQNLDNSPPGPAPTPSTTAPADAAESAAGISDHEGEDSSRPPADTLPTTDSASTGEPLGEPEPSGNEAGTAAPSHGDVAYEGTVRLNVTTRGPVSNLIAFVTELRQNPQYRVLRLVANQQQASMDVWLGLREPAPLLSSLMDIKGVEGVSTVDPPQDSTPDDAEPVLSVRLH